jgi:hypothetical protein
MSAVLRAVQRALRSGEDRPERRREAVQSPAVRPRSTLSGPELAERELLRLMLANDRRVSAEDLELDLFTLPEHRAYFEAVIPLLESTPAGTVIDLEALPDGFGGELRSVVLDDLPLDHDPKALVRRLERWRIERQIGEIRHRVDSEPAGSEPHSNLLRELIALELRKRELDSE